MTYRSSDGNVEARKYKPLRFAQGRLWGEVRQGTGELPTDYTFQAQRDAGWRLINFKARWLDPYLNRWNQPDSIIPDYKDPQSFDRYAFVRNNPVNRIDPTGHMDVCPDCGGGGELTDEEKLEKVKNLRKLDNLVYEFKKELAKGNFLLVVPNKVQLPQPICTVPSPKYIQGEELLYNPSDIAFDYITIAGSLSVPGSPIGFAGSYTVDRYSNMYLGGGISLGKTYVTGWSVAITGGLIGGDPSDGNIPAEFVTEKFLEGPALNAAIGAGLGTGITWSPFAYGKGNNFRDYFAIETGTYSPQVGMTIYYSWLVFDNR